MPLQICMGCNLFHTQRKVIRWPHWHYVVTATDNGQPQIHSLSKTALECKRSSFYGLLQLSPTKHQSALWYDKTFVKMEWAAKKRILQAIWGLGPGPGPGRRYYRHLLNRCLLENWDMRADMSCGVKVCHTCGGSPPSRLPGRESPQSAAAHWLQYQSQISSVQ